MRSTLHGPEAFLLKSKKPHIQALVSAAATMTEDEICALSEKPDVIKGLLGIRKLGDQARAATVAEQLADLMIAKHHPELARHI